MTPPPSPGPALAVTVPSYLLPLLTHLNAHGETGYPVGGCVRDSLRGVEPHDWDVAVTTPPERTKALFEAAGYRVIPTGIAHGTVTVLAPLGGDPTDRTGAYAPVECTTCRTEGGYTDSRHPDAVTFTGRIEDDLSRRDFTVNAMALVFSPQNPPCRHRGSTVDLPRKKNAEMAILPADPPAAAPSDGCAPPTVLDLFGGRDDLRQGVIRCVGDPDIRFEEDALRILRAVRFAVRLGFVIESATRAAIVRRRAGLARISRERITDELNRILCGPAPERGVAMLAELGLMPFVLPAGITPAASLEADTATSTLAPDRCVLDRIASVPSTERTWCPPASFPRLSALPGAAASRLAALLWGLAPAAIEANLAALRLPNTVKRAVAGMLSLGERPIPTTPFDMRRLRHELGDLTVPAWEIRLSHTPSEMPEAAEIKRLVECIRASEAAGEPVRISELAIGGRDLLALGLTPGPAVQALLEALLEPVWTDPAANTRETLLAYARRAILAAQD